ncbi:GAF domain-containing protein [soil metagenome]
MTVEELTFPDSPRSELEKTIEELVDRAQRVLMTQSRLRSLITANRVVVEGLELGEVLQRITAAAIELVDARYGALGVIGRDGLLEQFLQVGMSDEDAKRIGHLPEGHGLLGAVIETGAPIRLEHLADDPRSSGFPPLHPRMDGFLGVPIRVRGEVFGNLYLTEPRAGQFSHEDEELVTVLAATAGVAIENARLFDEANRRQQWSAALAEVTAALLSPDAGDPLDMLVERVADLIHADLVCLVVPAPKDGERLWVSNADGRLAGAVRDRRFSAAGSLIGSALQSGAPLLADSQDDGETFAGLPELGPTMVVPLAALSDSSGALTVSRSADGMRFTAVDLELATEFAAQAGVAIELARGRSDRQLLELAEDRSRIARDLHDHVIQRLFGAGLGLQSVASRAPRPVRESILDQISAIDSAIAEIRTVVFALSSGGPGRSESLRHRLLDVVGELSGSVQAAPRISFSGAVDLLVRDDLADDVVAVVRESLTNVAKHARATSTSIEVKVDESSLIVRVEDDGVGYRPRNRKASGTANLAQRAEARGGRYAIGSAPGTGTLVEWSVPMGGTR